jgi:hypothetical protein
MTGIWSETEHGWRALSPVGFAQEQELHELIERNPGMLPLAGSPRLVVLGSEVRCGNGFADLVAIEADTGVPVVIEIKLASNTDRKMVLTQVLSYAAYLHRLDAAGLNALLAPHLARAHVVGTLIDAVATGLEDPSFDKGAFSSALSESMASGRLRCVIVIDRAPTDVVDLVGYLQDVSNDRLSLDLVSVSAYQIGDRRVLVPQLVEPERTAAAPPIAHSTSAPVESEGAKVFVEAIGTSRAEHQALLRNLAEWALNLEKDGLAVLRTATGKGRWMLKPHLPGQQRGLVTIWNDGGGYVSPYRTVFEQEAPNSLLLLDERWQGQIGQGNYIDRQLLDEVLPVLRDAYSESARSGVRAT